MLGQSAKKCSEKSILSSSDLNLDIFSSEKMRICLTSGLIILCFETEWSYLGERIPVTTIDLDSSRDYLQCVWQSMSKPMAGLGENITWCNNGLIVSWPDNPDSLPECSVCVCLCMFSLFKLFCYYLVIDLVLVSFTFNKLSCMNCNANMM